MRRRVYLEAEALSRRNVCRTYARPSAGRKDNECRQVVTTDCLVSPDTGPGLARGLPGRPVRRGAQRLPARREQGHGVVKVNAGARLVMERASFSLGRQTPARRSTLILSNPWRGTPRAAASFYISLINTVCVVACLPTYLARIPQPSAVVLARALAMKCSREEEGGGVRSGPGEARTILLLHIISVRPSKQPLLVRTFLKVYMELGSSFLFLQEQIKDIIIMG